MLTRSGKIVLVLACAVLVAGPPVFGGATYALARLLRPTDYLWWTDAAVVGLAFGLWCKLAAAMWPFLDPRRP